MWVRETTPKAGGAQFLTYASPGTVQQEGLDPYFEVGWLGRLRFVYLEERAEVIVAEEDTELLVLEALLQAEEPAGRSHAAKEGRGGDWLLTGN